MSVPLENALRSRGYQSRGVAQPGSAPALGERTCRSNGSFGCVRLSLFSTTWGICFSLKANSKRVNDGGFATVLRQPKLFSEEIQVTPSRRGSPRA